MKKNGSWITLYEGRDTASTLTGLKNGEYAFRLREGQGDWSETLTVVIEHHPLWKAYAFFGAGFVLFIILCGLLFRSSQLKQVHAKQIRGDS